MAAPAFIHPRSLTVASSRATEISQAGAKAGRGSFRKRRCDAVLPNVPDRHHALGDHFQPPAKLLARTPLWDSRPTHEESRLRPVFGQSLSGTRRARRGAAPPLGETVERPQDVVVARADGYKMCQDGQRRARPRHIEASWPSSKLPAATGRRLGSWRGPDGGHLPTGRVLRSVADFVRSRAIVADFVRSQAAASAGQNSHEFCYGVAAARRRVARRRGLTTWERRPTGGRGRQCPPTGRTCRGIAARFANGGATASLLSVLIGAPPLVDHFRPEATWVPWRPPDANP